MKKSIFLFFLIFIFISLSLVTAQEVFEGTVVITPKTPIEEIASEDSIVYYLRVLNAKIVNISSYLGAPTDEVRQEGATDLSDKQTPSEELMSVKTFTLKNASNMYSGKKFTFPSVGGDTLSLVFDGYGTILRDYRFTAYLNDDLVDCHHWSFRKSLSVGWGLWTEHVCDEIYGDVGSVVGIKYQREGDSVNIQVNSPLIPDSCHNKSIDMGSSLSISQVCASN